MSVLDSPRSPGEEDRRRRQAIFWEVLERFPVTLTVDELVRTQATQRLGDQDSEPWERAITDLRREGLLRLNGDVIEPTLAAIQANDLLELTV